VESKKKSRKGRSFKMIELDGMVGIWGPSQLLVDRVACSWAGWRTVLLTHPVLEEVSVKEEEVVVVFRWTKDVTKRVSSNQRYESDRWKIQKDYDWDLAVAVAYFHLSVVEVKLDAVIQ
jgi:hypothetical protein